MEVTFDCPQCKKPIQADSDTVGDRIQCPACMEIVLVPAQGIEEGMELGGFRVEKKLGAGGMGEVFQATQVAMDRKVALKVLHPGVTSNEKLVNRFIHEVKMSGKLEHPNIVTAFDAGCADGYYYLAMSFVEGQNLEDRLKENGPLPEAEALSICMDVANALNYAWSKHQMLHRDIKPANIMIDEDGTIKLMDMGIARTISEDSSLTMQGSLIGTPYYMSPEQATDSHGLDARSDIYSLGASMYHLLTGKQPFTGANAMSVIAKHMSTELPPPTIHSPHLSQSCSTLICRMMEKDPDNRPEDWDALVGELKKVKAHKTAGDVLGPGKQTVKQDFDSTAGMTIISEVERKKLDEVVAASQNESVSEEVHHAPTEAASETESGEEGKSKSGLLIAAVVVILLAVAGGFAYMQWGNRGPSDPKPDPTNGGVAINNGNGTKPDDNGNGTKPDDNGNGTKPDDSGNGTKPDDNGNGTKPDDGRFRIENLGDGDNSPEHKKCKALLIAMYDMATKAEDIRTDWPKALAAWKDFKDKSQDLDRLLKADEKREALFRPPADQEKGRMQEMLKRVGNAYVKAATGEIEPLLAKAEFTDAIGKTVDDKLEAYSKFLNKYDLVGDFSAATMQRWEEKKRTLEQTLLSRRKANAAFAKAAKAVRRVRSDTDKLEKNWLNKGKSDIEAAGELRKALAAITGLKSGSEDETQKRTLDQKLSALLKQFSEATTLQNERRKVVSKKLPKMFKSRNEQKEHLQNIDLLRERIRAALNRVGSRPVIDRELAAIEKFRKVIQGVPVEDPWVQHQHAVTDALAKAAKAQKAGEPVRKALREAMANFDKAIAAGLVKKSPEANILSLVPDNLSDTEKLRLIGALANDSAVVDNYEFMDKKTLAKMPKADQIWFRRYPRKITVLIKRGGTGGSRIQAESMTFVLVPPAKWNKYETTRPFYMSTHEVSVGEYRRFSKSVLNRPLFLDEGLPVRNATYINAVRFCNWLSQQSGTKEKTYKCTAADPGKSSLDEWTRVAGTTSFALPTEAEWAVACYYNSKDDNPGDTPIHESFGAKRPLSRTEIAKRTVKANLLGIYCMRGNVAELISDAAGALLKREVTMGGHYKLSDDDVDGSNRQEIYPDDDRGGIGFRLSLPATQ